MEKISIIVPVYNVEMYLSKCIESLLHQTYKNLEIILVDDGSLDSSGVICDEYAMQDERVKVIHKENGGLSSARNAGIDIATGEYFGFVDSDDWIEDSMYFDLYTRIKETKTKLCVCGRYDWNKGKRHLGLCPYKSSVCMSERFFVELFHAKYCDVSACDKLYHKSLFESIRYPIGEINEDAAIIHNIIHAAKKISTLNKRLYNYNHREASITTSIFSERNLVELKHAMDISEFIIDEYPNIVNDAKAYYAKRLLGMCITLSRNSEYKELYQKFLCELSTKYRDLYIDDKIKYIFLKCGIYFAIRKAVKKVLKKY